MTPKIIERKIHQIDAAGQIAGRLASKIAFILIGKNKTSYRPNLDQGDFVELANVSKLKLSGKKIVKKIYYRPSGYPGGITPESLGHFFQRSPEKFFQQLVLGMLPKNTHRPQIIKRLTFKKSK